MSISRILGLVLLVVGVMLLAFGLHATGMFGERVTETVTGHYSNTTMWYIIGGAACAIAGGALTFLGGNGAMKA